MQSSSTWEVEVPAAVPAGLPEEVGCWGDSGDLFRFTFKRCVIRVIEGRENL